MKTKNIVLFLSVLCASLVMVLSVTSCSSNKQSVVSDKVSSSVSNADSKALKPVDLSQIIGEWNLYTMEDNNGDYPINVAVTINFASDTSIQMTGISGVNRYFGTVVIKDNSFTSSAIGATKMAGPVPEMETEDNYLRILTGVNQIQIVYTDEIEQLVLTGKNGEKLVFVK